MSPQTLQLITTIIGALIIASIIAIAKWITGKADKSAVVKLEGEQAAKADRVELNRVESESKAANQKLEVKLDAALLIVGAAITRPELAEKILAMTGRADDQKLRIQADIVQLFTDTKANAKASAETDKKLDDLPGRVRTLEENQRK